MCRQCNDTGFIAVKGKDNTFTPCECAKHDQMVVRLRKAGLTLSAMNKTFKNYEPLNSETKKMKEVAGGYALIFKDFKIAPREHNSLALLGQPGSGKTHLLIAVMNVLMKNDTDIQYISYPEEMAILKQNVLNEQVINSKMKKFKTCDLLVMDDLFKNGYTASDLRLIFEIVNSRYINQKSIAISSELTILDIKNIDGALAGRIKAMTDRYRYEIIGSQYDYRMRKVK
ncbi:ATP-binding protein [Clostridium saccharoperbutylacetonicum]|uniref:ATP-binding protein n=1 Tax=Clostridium saccharoperbutylacetonicum TaxID=36745 RepID=UPI0039E86DA1